MGLCYFRYYRIYFHGIFDEPSVKQWFLSCVDPSYRAKKDEKGSQESYELLAAHFSEHLDLDKVYDIIDQPAIV